MLHLGLGFNEASIDKKLVSDIILQVYIHREQQNLFQKSQLAANCRHRQPDKTLSLVFGFTHLGGINVCKSS